MRLVSNSLWNLAGGIVPAVAAIITVPLVVSRLGEVHYGLLTLITSIVGYFALLDVNTTQGSVKFLAEFNSRRDQTSINQLFSLGAALGLAIGAVGGLAIAFFAEDLATRVFNVPTALHELTTQALRFGGAAFFFTQLQVYLLSVPQSLHRFDVSARSEALFGSLASLSTALIVLLGGGLVEIMAARAVIAAANVAVLARMVAHLLPELKPAWPGRNLVKGLMSFSMYGYLSRFSSISYASADKLLIGAYVDMKSLALYSVPFLLANRLFSLTYRLGSVMLPEASRLQALGEHEVLRRKYLAAARLMLFVNCCIACLLILLGRELLYYWAGPAFGPEAAWILLLVTTAVWVDSMTNLPSLVNDGMGKPANTGIFSAVRALVGLVGAWVAVRSHGIEGVAWAQVVVSTLAGSAFLVWVHHRVLPATMSEFLRFAVAPCLLPWSLCVGYAWLGLHRELFSMQWSLVIAAGATLALAAYGWWWVLSHQQREQLVAAANRQWRTLRARRA